MLGTINQDIKEVVVVGGGISGLLASHRLLEKGFSVELIEKSPTPGGLIKTEMTPLGMSERAAHSILITSDILLYFSKTGVEPDWCKSKKRWIYRDGKARRMPLGPGQLLRTLGRAAFTKSSGEKNLSLEDWARTYLGDEAKDYLIDPMVCGIFGARPSEISQSAAFPSLEIPKGKTVLSLMSRKKSQGARPRMGAPKLGMQDLVDKIFSALKRYPKFTSKFETEVSSLEHYKKINRVLCVPSGVASRLIEGEHPKTAFELREKVKYAPLISVTVWVKESQLGVRPEGVGVLFPSSQVPDHLPGILGVLYNSDSFNQRTRAGYVSLTVMLGGTRSPEVLSKSDSEIESLVLGALDHLFRGPNLTQGDLTLKIWRHAHAIPIYNSELESLWASAREGWCEQPGNVLFGNYTGAVSIRGMIESVAKL